VNRSSRQRGLAGRNPGHRRDEMSPGSGQMCQRRHRPAAVLERHQDRGRRLRIRLWPKSSRSVRGTSSSRGREAVSSGDGIEGRPRRASGARAAAPSTDSRHRAARADSANEPGTPTGSVRGHRHHRARGAGCSAGRGVEEGRSNAGMRWRRDRGKKSAGRPAARWRLAVGEEGSVALGQIDTAAAGASG